MAATFAPNAAEGGSLPCRICGRSAPRGAKLCDQCNAAVRRARQTRTVVSEVIPATSAATRAVGLGAGARARHSFRRWFESALPPGVWGACAAIIVFGTAMALTGYFAVIEIAEEPELLTVEASEPGALSPEATLKESPSTSEASAPAPAAKANAQPVPAERGAASSGTEASSASNRGAERRSATAPAKPAHATASAARARKGASSAADREQALAAARAAPSVMSEQAVQAPAPSPAASIDNEPVIPDRWQSMHAALAGCSRENFLAGIVCDQRTRWRYCEGYWGKVPECRAAADLGNAR